jgi:large subunit ribosomal protein L25
MASTTTHSLAVTTREKTGTTAAHAIRHAGNVPGVLFGHGSAPIAIELNARAFDDLLHAGAKNALLEITIDGGKRDTALVREVQRDPITRRVIHADLQRVSATERISAELPLVAIGTPEGVRNGGGVMDVVLHTVAIAGPANELPEHIEHDVSSLGVGAHVTAADLKLPAGFTLDMDPHAMLISIEASRTESQAAASAPAADATVPTVGEANADAAGAS